MRYCFYLECLCHFDERDEAFVGNPGGGMIIS